MRFSSISLFVSLASLALGAPKSPDCGQQALAAFGGTWVQVQEKAQAGSGGSQDPCALISQQYDQQMAADSSVPQTIYSPTLLLQCLQTVPMVPDLATNLTNYIANFLQFQSTVAYLKDPPSTYPYPPVDLLGGFSAIADNVTKGVYENWYDYELDMLLLIKASYDGHLSLTLPLIGSFTFMPGVDLISLSQDGKALPGVYWKDDFMEYTGDYTPSDVVTINGANVTEFLLALGSNFEDLDAMYNAMFWNPGIATFFPEGLFGGGFPFIYTTETYTYAFRNGSNHQVQNSALSKVSLANITSGQDVFDQLIAPQPTPISPDGPSKRGAAPISQKRSYEPPAVQLQEEMTMLGYPDPVVISPDNTVAGYFLPNVSDTAALSIRQFVDQDGMPEGQNWPWNFQNTITQFLAICAKEGKKRLIIDIRGNPGGAVSTGFDTFKQLFPGLQIITKATMRLHPAANAMGEIFSQAGEFTTAQYNLLASNPQVDLQTLDAYAAGESSFDAQDYLNASNGDHFTSWSQFGPMSDHGDTFSEYFSLDLSDTALDLSSDGIIISGYGNLTDLPPQVFQAEDMLSDGICSSTCTIFAHLMLTWGKVPTIAIGGLPTDDQMAVIGGVQGSQTWTSDILAQQALYAAVLSEDITWASTDDMNAALDALGPLIYPVAVNFEPSNLQVNFLNSFAGGDLTSDIPLQFQPPEPANCRVFNTIDDYVGVVYTWQRLATGNYICVDGGQKW